LNAKQSTLDRRRTGSESVAVGSVVRGKDSIDKVIDRIHTHGRHGSSADSKQTVHILSIGATVFSLAKFLSLSLALLPLQRGLALGLDVAGAQTLARLFAKVEADEIALLLSF
jgi:hypothetical protein